LIACFGLIKFGQLNAAGNSHILKLIQYFKINCVSGMAFLLPRAPEALPYFAIGAVLKGENYWEMLPELAERSSAVEFVV
jgi:hypothetical protein